ncbi:MAG: pantetheine-phosphate adenylyltransferase [Dehalococcoidia bacterium]|nr:pantetheine-phosphate adenylyltransferase [Dehalococcoidia bacterium]
MMIAVYPGSFDPFTNGHLDVARRAARLFDRLVIGVYATPEKKLLFDLDERVALARAAVSAFSNIEVRPYSGLTVELARAATAQIIVRGLRVSADFEFEFDLAMMTHKLSPDLEMLCLMASPQYQFLSASLLKEVARLGGNVDDWVPAEVAEAVKTKVGRTI